MRAAVSQLYAVSVRDGFDGVDYGIHLCMGGSTEQVLPSQELVPDLHEAEYAAVRVTLELPAQEFELPLVVLRPDVPVHEDGVVPPQASVRTQPVGYLAERFRDIRLRGDVGFEVFPIGSNGHLEYRHVPHRSDLPQIGNYRCGVLGDEHEGVDVAPGQVHSVHERIVHRVADHAVSGAEAVHQPFRMERGDVRSPAGADDHICSDGGRANESIGRMRSDLVPDEGLGLNHMWGLVNLSFG